MIPTSSSKRTANARLGKLAELYLEQHAKRKKRSWRDDARMIRQELEIWEHRPVASIRRADVRDLLEGIVQRRAPVLSNRVLALVRKVLNFALDREWVDANVAAKMARPADKLPHRVPLTTLAVKILKALQAQAGKDAVHVFEGIRGARHRRGVLDGLPLEDVRPHDFRRTAASMMAAGGVPRLTIAKVLNHVETSITAVYDRHSYDPKKQAALACGTRG